MRVTFWTASGATRTDTAPQIIGGLSAADRVSIDAASQAVAAGQFTSRAAAMAATIAAPIQRIGVVTAGGLLEYVRDPAGTALTTADGAKWSPADGVTPLHFGAVGDGASDDTAAIRAAVAYAAMIQPANASVIEIDLKGRRYAISGTITLTGPIVLVNGHLQATGTFPQGSYMIDTTVDARLAGMREVSLDGARRANIVRGNTQGLILHKVRGYHFPDYGVRALKVAHIEHCAFSEWDWSDPQRLLWAERTATGISIEHADGFISNTNASICRVPLYCNAINTRVINSHFWNGGAADTPAEAECVVLDQAEACVFVSNYFDNGRLRVTGKFGHTLTGNIFVKNQDGYNDSPLYIETAATNETVAGLIVSDNSFIGQFPGGLVQFGGTGTFVPDERKRMDWSGNKRTSGTGSDWKDFKAGDKLTLSGATAEFGYTFDNYYSLSFHSGARLRAATTGSGAAAENIALAYGDTDTHLFTRNSFLFGMGSSTPAGAPLMRLMAEGVNGFSIHPVNAAGATDYNASFQWKSADAAWRFKAGRVELGAVPSQTYSEIRTDRMMRFDVDFDNNHTANRIIEYAFAGTLRHRLTQTTFDVGVGYGGGAVGGALRLEAATGGIARLSPSDGAGAYDAGKSFEWDGTRWRFRGGRLSMHGLPTSAAGLTAGDVWVDAAAGNVLKVV